MDHESMSGKGPDERLVRPDSEARWYCLSTGWMATLCSDESDARQNVLEADALYARFAPHRAVQLVDAQEPLTDDQVLKMWRASDFRGSGGQADWFAEGVRAGERAHGMLLTFADALVAAESERWVTAAAAALEVLDDMPAWSNAAHACKLLRDALGPND